MKKITLFAFICTFALVASAIDFSVNMSADEARQYIEENAESDGFNNKIADAIICIAENQECNYATLTEKIGNEKAIMALNSLLTSAVYKDSAAAILTTQIYQGSAIFNEKRFNLIFTATCYNGGDDAVRSKIKETLTKEQIRKYTYEMIVYYISTIEDVDAYDAAAAAHLSSMLNSYRKLYLEGDVETVKAELEKMYSSAYLLIETTEYMPIIKKIVKMKKSLNRE